MNKILRIVATILVVALALYLMVTLFIVFLVLAGIGLLYLLFLRFFGKSYRVNVASDNVTPSEGVIIEHEPVANKDHIKDER